MKLALFGAGKIRRSFMMAQVPFAAMRFKATGADGKMFPEDIRFHKELENKGIEGILRDVCGFSDDRRGLRLLTVCKKLF